MSKKYTKKSYTYTAHVGERHHPDGVVERVLFFGEVAYDMPDGTKKRFAVVAPWPEHVPIDQMVLYERPDGVSWDSDDVPQPKDCPICDTTMEFHDHTHEEN